VVIGGVEAIGDKRPNLPLITNRAD